jgi:hypothetical protein
MSGMYALPPVATHDARGCFLWQSAGFLAAKPIPIGMIGMRDRRVGVGAIGGVEAATDDRPFDARQSAKGISLRMSRRLERTARRESDDCIRYVRAPPLFRPSETCELHFASQRLAKSQKLWTRSNTHV